MFDDDQDRVDVGARRLDSAERLDRNRSIVAAYRSGEAMATIATRHGLSTERVRQLVRRAEGQRPRSRRHLASEGERVRLRIGNLAKAVLVTGQAYQDPKDALNEFVSNAADDYAESGLVGGRIRILLRRRGSRAVIAVDDAGRGMTPDRLRDVARNLFESSKAGDERTLGEKAIGLLAFQQLGARCEVVSRTVGSDETWTLRLRRGEASADLVRERRRAREMPGTTVYISELDNEALRVLTQRKLVDYLRRRRGQAIGERHLLDRGRRRPHRRTGDPGRAGRLPIPMPLGTRCGGGSSSPSTSPPMPTPADRVAIVGRAGTTIIDDIAELEEFDRDPWTSGRVSGRISFEPLRQTAGRRAVLRDDEIYPVFHDAVLSVEPVADDGDRAAPHRSGRGDGRSPLRCVAASLWSRAQGARRSGEPNAHAARRRARRGCRRRRPLAGAGLQVATATAVEATTYRGSTNWNRAPHTRRAPMPAHSAAASGGGRYRHLPSIQADDEPGHRRSRFDAERGIVLYNEQHADFLLVKADEPALLDYLATLVAKEYVVYNNPRAAADELAEELVRMLVRVRRHLSLRRRR